MNIAQVGWLQRINTDGTTRLTGFTEQNDNFGNTEFKHYFGGLYYGQMLPGNMVVYTPNNLPGGENTFTFYGGGNQVDNSIADFVPDSAGNYTESHTVASAMPGTTHDGGEQFKGVQVWVGTPGNTGSWQNFAGTPDQFNASGNGVRPGYYWGQGFDYPPPQQPQTHIWEWDNACS